MLDLTFFTLFLSFISVLISIIFFIATTSQPPDKTPCPESYPIIGNLPGFLRNRHRFHEWVTDMLSQTPSSTIKVSSPFFYGICTADPLNVEHLLVTNFSNYTKGSRFLNYLYELLGDGIFNVDGHLWTMQRKIATFDDAEEICFSRFLSPFPFIWKLKRFFDIGSEKRFKEAIKIINEFALEIIKSKQEENSESAGKNQDLLSRFMFLSSNIEFQDQEHKIKFLRDIVISFVLAGKDTTSTVLTWFFWLVAGNPRCGYLIYQELTEVGTPPESEAVSVEEIRARIFSYDELKKLHYLHACLSETMRLFPPIAINSRLAVDDDVLPDGTHVGKGSSVDYSAYAMGRMEKVWGPDCREFKPERWLDKEGKYQPSDQFRFPVFHCGPRTCLGKDLAYIQMKAIAAAVMYEFEILAIDEGANVERMMDPPYVITMLLKKRGGLPVRLKRREKRIKNSKVSIKS
ncbi:cytochrome P450 94C1 isoform X2 [Jatropha curcas]|uniref:cytochrome P450 94C1 isoform X2 n=1 Tax=Jatropha curcas TaxID=180498 RepID=UPI0018941DDA|nr:cytochrome P450 94C1 isoform X2 [Jatropha curcas]